MTSLTNKDKDLGVRVSRLKNELTRKLDELSPKHHMVIRFTL